MDPTATDQPDLDFILRGVGASASGTAAAPAATIETIATDMASKPPATTAPNTNNTTPTNSDHVDHVDHDAAASGAASTAINPKKRPLEDKKARDRKRILRNRQLARVSNERRKGRIKAMESELQETKQTVSTLEDSIRCLEEENRELRNLLQGKPDSNAPASSSVVVSAPAPPTGSGAPTIPPSV